MHGWEGEENRGCSGQSGGTSITRTKLPPPLLHPGPAQNQAVRKPVTAKGNRHPERGRGRQDS